MRPTLIAALLFTGCSSLALHETMNEPLPPPAERGSVGAWKLGETDCTGAIQSAEGHYFWINDCQSKIGYGWCDFGLRVEKRGPSEYVNKDKDWRFKIEDDGTLTETRKGERIANHAKSDFGICRVRAVK